MMYHSSILKQAHTGKCKAKSSSALIYGRIDAFHTANSLSNGLVIIFPM